MNSSASNKTAPNPERLGRNHGRYGGETIDIATVLEECIQAADSDWRHERISAAD